MARLEPIVHFNRRRFCSPECKQASQVCGGERGASTTRKEASGMRGEACIFCGTGDDLVAHHVNEDPSDNRQENVETLCRGCHSTLHNLMRRASCG